LWQQLEERVHLGRRTLLRTQRGEESPRRLRHDGQPEARERRQTSKNRCKVGRGSLGLSLILYAVAVAGALAGALARKQMIFCIGKPIATVLLFAVLGGMPTDLFGYLVFNGIVLSLAADITLLAEGNEALVVGLGLFLVAHLCYGLAFFVAGPGGWLVLPGLVVFGACAAWLVRRQWRGMEPGLRAPVGAHA